MHICGPTMNKFIITSDWEIKNFALKLINDLARNHPCQKNYVLDIQIL